jgi:hypothetical protein
MKEITPLLSIATQIFRDIAEFLFIYLFIYFVYSTVSRGTSKDVLRNPDLYAPMYTLRVCTEPHKGVCEIRCMLTFLDAQ